ncbi:hypothetical protein [Capnocytophaga cynodegmi]|uniref:Uncharacterized protein n=1 Tax=Capnocytophaga cynodegmi TaxID=28189 RepID=A0A0B7H6A7_9FLAO|nr:hypothetical protein [Capnocytophaga cynodegmi]CEN34910.1 conserved exported hypothetical protein [Capnocytophaga cynodegmi]
MKTNKLNSETVTGAAAFTGGAIAGAMGSRVLADKIPLKNSKLKRGLLAIVGVVGAAMINGKDNAGKALQGAAAGMAATQLGELVKEMVNPQEGILKTALGTPENPIIILPSDVNNYDYQTLDNPYEKQQQFLAAAVEKKFAPV